MNNKQIIMNKEVGRFINEDLSIYIQDAPLAKEYISIVKDWVERLDFVDKEYPNLELVISSNAIMNGMFLTTVNIEYYYNDNEIFTLEIDLDPVGCAFNYTYYSLSLYENQTYDTEDERIMANRKVKPQTYKKGDENIILEQIVKALKN